MKSLIQRNREALAKALIHDPDYDRAKVLEIYKEARLTTLKLANCVATDDPLQIIMHVDHIRPLSKGGAHHQDNLQIISARENLEKGANYE
jgi:5-methylcytosine-specific restriction endonuclease McrA